MKLLYGECDDRRVAEKRAEKKNRNNSNGLVNALKREKNWLNPDFDIDFTQKLTTKSHLSHT